MRKSFVVLSLKQIQKLAIALLLCVMVLFSSLLFSGKANAQEVQLSGRFASNKALSGQRVPMYLNCSKETASHLKYLIQHGICPSNTNELKSNAISPNNEVGGSCGSSYLYGADQNGDALFTYGATSSVGPITGGSYMISWTGGNNSNFVGPVSANNGPSSWADASPAITGTGRITATMTGGANVLIAGLFTDFCTFNDPTTVVTI